MASLDPALESAVDDALSQSPDQSAEFKRRFRQLIVNAATSNLSDSDVREVIELVSADEEISAAEISLEDLDL